MGEAAPAPFRVLAQPFLAVAASPSPMDLRTSVVVSETIGADPSSDICDAAHIGVHAPAKTYRLIK
jgi:hypothetical protein